MRSHPTPSFTTEPHSKTYLIHPPVSSFRVCCCCACSFMLILPHPTPPSQIERGRESEKDISASRDSKSVIHFQIVSATASTVTFAPPLLSPLLYTTLKCCLGLCGRLAKGKLNNRGTKIKGEGSET